MQHIKPFDEKLVYTSYKSDSLNLYEIENKDIKKVIQNSKFTWIHIWSAVCSNGICKNIGVFDEKATSHPEISFLMISNSYELKEIKERVGNSNFNRPIFVLKNSYYGKKKFPAERKVTRELVPKTQKIKGVLNNYLFKDTTLIFAGENLESKLDSIMNFYN